MLFHIDYNSSQPIYQQVIEQIKLTVVNGGLHPGDRMPSIRELAKTLRINPTTAARIYNELAYEGVLVLRQGQGAFVAPKVVSVASEEIHRIVSALARKTLVEGMRLGLAREEIDLIIDREYQRIRKGEG
ncbi:MAG: GntR family transcriptional regulator [Candidatus Poribacteria bacterium]|nr:GntR family transcriptional regulator [Candidatus Poribacteria bacterium]MDE0503949.1 GntR family transcriptional regulator [Candidatus Poribacteria bacterium]